MKLTEKQLRKVIRESILLESNYTIGVELSSLVKNIKKIAYECGRRSIGIASQLPKNFHYGDMTGITPILSYKGQNGTTESLNIDLPVFLRGTSTPWESIDPFERDMFVAELLEEFPGSKKISNTQIKLKTMGSAKYFDRNSIMGMIPGSFSF